MRGYSTAFLPRSWVPRFHLPSKVSAEAIWKPGSECGSRTSAGRRLLPGHQALTCCTSPSPKERVCPPPHPETLTPPRTAPLHPTASSHPLTGHSAGRKAAGLSCRPPPARVQCWAAGCPSRSPWGAPACCPHRPRRSVQAGTPCSGGPWPLSLEQSGWTWLAAPPGLSWGWGFPPSADSDAPTGRQGWPCRTDVLTEAQREGACPGLLRA